jgi:3-methyladenine DNA glycosylase/8-oxoguanine DNA glycosylase
MLPPHEIKPNTRGVLEGKFSQLPPHFVELAREELIAANGVRSRVRYLNGIADRMIDERAARREVA